MRHRTWQLDAKSASGMYLLWAGSSMLFGLVLIREGWWGSPIHMLFPTFPLLCMIAASRFFVPEEITDPSPNGAAWVLRCRRDLVRCAILGASLGTLATVISALAARHTPPLTQTIIEGMAHRRGLPQVFWLTQVLIAAPIGEEFLHRGILYGGYAKSFGERWACVLTTLMFMAGHVPGILYRPLQGGCIFGLSCAALLARRRLASVWAAVAVHFGYNAIVALRIVLRDVAHR